MAETLNAQIAGRLEEVARLLAHQGANPYRVGAYARAAETLRHLSVPVSEILQSQGILGLDWLPEIGPRLARAIRDLATTGRLPMLERMRGESDPLSLLASVPGVGETLAERLHHDLGIGTLEDLEAAAHDGRLENVAGIGPKRLAGIRDALAGRLGRLRRPAPVIPPEDPPVEELLSVDREYRSKSLRGELKLIAPRRFNAAGKAWLPVLHTTGGDRDYTALFSNTARAHQFDRTHDWVVLYADGGRTERQYTVITARRGALKGRRIVRGREVECADYYARRGATVTRPQRSAPRIGSPSRGLSPSQSTSMHRLFRCFLVAVGTPARHAPSPYRPRLRALTVTTVPLLTKELARTYPSLAQDFAKGRVLDGKEVYVFVPSTLVVYVGDTLDLTFFNPEDDAHTFVLKRAQAFHESEGNCTTRVESLIRSSLRQVGLTAPEPLPARLVERVRKGCAALLEFEHQICGKVGHTRVNVDKQKIRNAVWDRLQHRPIDWTLAAVTNRRRSSICGGRSGRGGQ